MGSFHELKATTFAQADRSSSRFGWEPELAVRRKETERKAAKHPTPPPTEPAITPDMVRFAMQGGFRLPEQATSSRSPRILRAPDPDAFDYGSGRREAASRRKKMADHRDRGERSSQGQGRGGR
jgi:hypothetical protein